MLGSAVVWRGDEEEMHGGSLVTYGHQMGFSVDGLRMCVWFRRDYLESNLHCRIEVTRDSDINMSLQLSPYRRWVIFDD